MGSLSSYRIQMSLLCLSFPWSRYLSLFILTSYLLPPLTSHLSPLTSYLSPLLHIYRVESRFTLHGLRPVWTFDEGYPADEIPAYSRTSWRKWPAFKVFFFSCVGSLAADLSYANRYCCAGLNELVEAVDHPAYVIQDNIEVVPF